MMLRPNFSRREIACPCCNGLIANDTALDALQRLRDRWGPITLNSAYRCPRHNAAVGGGAQSRHLFGKAFDVRIGPDEDRERFLAMAMASGFRGVGLYDGFVHLDTREDGAFWDARSGK